MAASPTQRTLKALRERGAVCGVVERWNQFAGPHGIRQDLFGFIDVVSLNTTDCQIVGVQCCAGSGLAAHRKKIIEDCRDYAFLWLRCGGAIEIWAWRKLKVRRGGKAVRWQPIIENITAEQLNQYGS